MENDNQVLLDELCYIYWERNKLQDRRNATRFKLCRAKNKFAKVKSAATKLAVMKATKASLEVRIAIAEHVTQTTKRIRELTKATGYHPSTSGCNKIKYLRCYHNDSGADYLEYYRFEKQAQAHLARLAIELMLRG